MTSWILDDSLSAFPSAVVTGCHFHLGQSVMRKVNELDLKTIYTSDQEFALHARMLYGLTYVPAADVPTALEIIRSTMPAEGQLLVQYFDSTYVNGSVARSARTRTNHVVRRPPMFHPAMWNVAELFEHDLPTTNNHVEATSSIFSVFEMRSKYKIITICNFCILIFCLMNFLPVAFSAFWFSAFWLSAF